ncbi:hypothetical protein C4552_04000 [Candidatus Parcubacteria bacterium]|nr:MAG: hypothetical protein C4552_04000 [Candidatus Parcubacteria bacterium]
MDETEPPRIKPFPEVVREMLSPIRLVGIQADPYKQGAVEAVLTLISEVEIPAEDVERMLAVCTTARQTLMVAMPQAHGRHHRVYLRVVLELADEVITNLQSRTAQAAAAVPAVAAATR